MPNRRSLRLKESLLLLIPALLLGLFAYATRDRGPFHLVIDEAKLDLNPSKTSLRQYPPDLKAKVVKVRVSLSYEGNRPRWWGKGLNLDARVHFSDDEKDDGSNVGAYDGCNYAESSDRYFFNYEGFIPKSPRFLKGAKCQIEARLRTQDVPSKKVAKVRIVLPVEKMSR